MDTTSEPGSWAAAIPFCQHIKVSEYTADPLADLRDELDRRLARRKAIREGYQAAQVRG